jgi:hypothetical protein
MLLDRWLGTSPWLLFVGLVLGFAAGGLSNLVRDQRRVAARLVVSSSIPIPFIPTTCPSSHHACSERSVDAAIRA